MGNYLYNGVELPALPEWDKEAYPYAYILESYGTTYLFFTEVAVNFRYISSLGYMLANKVDGANVDFNYLRYTANSDSWGDLHAGNYYYALGAYEKTTVWCNTDLYHYDKDTDERTLVLAACPDPVPVGIAPEIDPFSMTMGWLVGSWIAGQRGGK